MQISLNGLSIICFGRGFSVFFLRDSKAGFGCDFFWFCYQYQYVIDTSILNNVKGRLRLTLPPIIKIKLKFLFSHFFVVPQKASLKPFKAPQRSVKIKI